MEYANDRKEDRANTTTSREDLRSLMYNINYNNMIDRGGVVDAFQRAVVPWPPIGSDKNGEIYSIVPAAYGLRVEQANPKTDHDVASTNLPAFYFSSRSKNSLPESSSN